MKKWLFYALTLALIPALSFGGLGGEDIGKLQPVQVVIVRAEGEQLVLMTDTEDSGKGGDIHRAIHDMKQTAPANVFLDTADYLLLEPETEEYLPQLRAYLRPSCSLCYVTGNVSLEKAGEFLQFHEPKLTLTQYDAGKRDIPYLLEEEGRMKLVQPKNTLPATDRLASGSHYPNGDSAHCRIILA